MQSPYMGGTADIVRDFVASCRRFGVSPCLYFNPAKDGALEKKNSTAQEYLATQLATGLPCASLGWSLIF